MSKNGTEYCPNPFYIMVKEIKLFNLRKKSFFKKVKYRISNYLKSVYN